MKLEAFSLRDVKGEIFAAPFFVPNHNIARRLLTQLVQDQRSDLGKYPEDFQLYSIGFYETSTGLLTPHTIELVCSATSCLPRNLAPVAVDSALVSCGAAGASLSDDKSQEEK